MPNGDFRIVYGLINFLVELLSLYLPALIGSFLSWYIKRDRLIARARKDKKKRPRYKMREVIFSITVSAILPAIVMTVIHSIILNREHNDIIIMAITALLGAMGDDLRKILTPKGITTIIKLVVKGAAVIDELGTSVDLNVVTDEDKTDDKPDDEKEDDNE